MPAIIVSTIRDGVSGAGVYPSLAAWKAALPANLVTADQVHIAEVEHKAGGWPLPALMFDNVTDATRYIEIRPAPGHGHTGVFSSDRVYFTGAPTADVIALDFQNSWAFVTGIQFTVSATNCAVRFLRSFTPNVAGSKHVFRRCIFKGTTSGASGALYATESVGYYDMVVESCIAHGLVNTNFPSSANSVLIKHSYGAAYGYNNTAVDCSSFCNTGSVGKLVLKNNLSNCKAFLASRSDYANPGSKIDLTASTNNASGDTTAPGVNSRTGQTFAFKSSTDFRLLGTDTGALNFGADLSADSVWPVTLDVGGQTRVAPYDIGADELDPAQTLTVTKGLADRIIQRVSGAGSISVSGTYSGTPAAIQARLVLAGTNTVVGADWSNVVASPSGGVFTFTVAGIPAARQWYEVQVRFSDDPLATDKTHQFQVGALVLVAGQSNGANFVASASGASAADPNTRIFGRGFANWATNIGAGAVAFANSLSASLGCGVGLVATAVGGTSIAQWAPGQSTYEECKTYITQAGGLVEAVLWVQGEADMNGTTYATYTAGMNATMSGLRAHMNALTVPVIVATLGNTTYPVATYHQVKRAQYDWVANDGYSTVLEKADLPTSDGLHLSAAGQISMGARAAFIYTAVRAGSNSRGPRVRKINKINATTYDVQLLLGASTDVSPSNGATGFTCKDPGAGDAAIAITSVTRTAPAVVRLVLASTPVAAQPLFGYFASAQPDVSAPLLGNTSVPLPLDYAVDVQSRTLATSVSLPLTTDGSTPAANLAGQKWAFFDQATPDLLAAPVAKGAAESTDASGNLVVNITGTDLSAGDVGWLIVTDSNGDPAMNHKAFSGPVAVS